MLIEIHYSELISYMRCDWQWFRRYKQQLAFASPPSPNLVLGSLWHKMVETKHVQGHQAALDLWEQETGGAMMASGDFRWLPGMLEKYHDWYVGSGYKAVLLEQELRLPYTHPSFPHCICSSADAPGVRLDILCPIHDELQVPIEVVLVGTLDRLYLDKDNQYWIGEDKTTRSHSESHLLQDQQGLTYKLISYELGIPTEGVLYVQARKTNPATARAEVIKAYPVPFPDIAVQRQAQQLDIIIPRLVQWHLAPEKDIEAIAVRRFNPLIWQGCYCDYEQDCLAWRYGTGDSELVHHDPNAHRKEGGEYAFGE